MASTATLCCWNIHRITLGVHQTWQPASFGKSRIEAGFAVHHVERGGDVHLSWSGKLVGIRSSDGGTK